MLFVSLHASKTSDGPPVALGQAVLSLAEFDEESSQGYPRFKPTELYLSFNFSHSHKLLGFSFQIKLNLRCKQIEVLEIPSAGLELDKSPLKLANSV